MASDTGELLLRRLNDVRTGADLQKLKLEAGRPALVAAWNQLSPERRDVLKFMVAFQGTLNIPDDPASDEQ